MRVLRGARSFAAAILCLLGAGAATAASITYNLVVGPNSVISSVTVGDDQSTNRLTAPVSLTAGEVVVDLDPATRELQILSISAAGPGVVTLGGINGWDTATFTNATLTSTASSPLFPTAVPDTYNYGLPVQVVATLQLVGPGASFDGPFSAPTGAAGELIAISGLDAIQLSITGVTLGALPDPSNPSAPLVLVKGDFNFLAVRAAPEPAALALLALGFATLVARRGRA